MQRLVNALLALSSRLVLSLPGLGAFLPHPVLAWRDLTGGVFTSSVSAGSLVEAPLPDSDDATDKGSSLVGALRCA